MNELESCGSDTHRSMSGTQPRHTHHIWNSSTWMYFVVTLGYFRCPGPCPFTLLLGNPPGILGSVFYVLLKYQFLIFRKLLQVVVLSDVWVDYSLKCKILNLYYLVRFSLDLYGQTLQDTFFIVLFLFLSQILSSQSPKKKGHLCDFFYVSDSFLRFFFFNISYQKLEPMRSINNYR